MPLWLTLVLLTLATARVTRFLAKDDFPPMFWVRERIIRMRPDHTVYPAGQTPYENHWFLAELITCPYCASAYVAGAGTLIVWGMNGMPLPVLCWLAVWCGAAALAARI